MKLVKEITKPMLGWTFVKVSSVKVFSIGINNDNLLLLWFIDGKFLLIKNCLSLSVDNLRFAQITGVERIC